MWGALAMNDLFAKATAKERVHIQGLEEFRGEVVSHLLPPSVTRQGKDDIITLALASPARRRRQHDRAQVTLTPGSGCILVAGARGATMVRAKEPAVQYLQGVWTFRGRRRGVLPGRGQDWKQSENSVNMPRHVSV